VYAALSLITILTARDFNHIVPGERRIFMLLGARILFGVLSNFLNDQTFAIFAARVLMAVVEEFLVVIAYTIVSLTTPTFREG
jgi:hypothetical protein